MSPRWVMWGIGALVGVLTLGFLLGEWAPRRFPSPRGRRALSRMALVTAALGGLIGLGLGGGYLATVGKGQAFVLTLYEPRDVVLPRAPETTVKLVAFPLVLRLDGLAALFLLFVGFFAFALALYSWGWLRDDPRAHWVAGAFNLFVLSMYAVILTYNMFWLLLALELMTLASGHLLLYRSEVDRGEEAQRAGRIAVRTYFIVSHVSMAFLMSGFILLALRTGSPLFTLTPRNTMQDVVRGSLMDHVIFALLLLGLGIRAGMVPFHFWVPIAHPQLPTNTHAMMSAVMLKIPVYLMIRVFVQVYPPRAWWWGGVLLLLAGGTALFNVFYALVSPDLKRALAYHSVENIGIILAGVGLALLFRYEWLTRAYGAEGYETFQTLTALALVAALYHTVNHGVFKTLLFMGTGNIERLTGTVKLKALSGVLRLSPWTGLTFLVGAMAIVGLPPFNGFISEWLTLQAIFVSGEALSRAGHFIHLVLTVVALLTLGGAFALTALAFVKIAGETLLGPPLRVSSRRTPWSMRVAMGVLALLCVLLGLAPGVLVPVLHRAVYDVGVGTTAVQATRWTLAVSVPLGQPRQEMYSAALSLVPALALILLAVLAGGGVLMLRWRRVWQRGQVWAGGERFDPRRMRYSGTAFSFMAWEILARPTPPSEIPVGPLPEYYRVSRRRVVPEFFNRWYNRLIRFTLDMSERLGNVFQSGDIRLYLMYIFVAFFVVLLATLFLRR